VSGTLFVYGTLMRGMAAEAILLASGPVAFRGRARMPGTLYDFGPFPGAVPEKPSGLRAVRAEDVAGEVFDLARPEETLRALDAHEGYSPGWPASSLFVRRLVRVRLDAGGETAAWAYLYARSVRGARLVPSGDYRRR